MPKFITPTFSKEYTGGILFQPPLLGTSEPVDMLFDGFIIELYTNL